MHHYCFEKPFYQLCLFHLICYPIFHIPAYLLSVGFNHLYRKCHSKLVLISISVWSLQLIKFCSFCCCCLILDFPVTCKPLNFCLMVNYSNLGDNCIQNFYFGRYIAGYMVGNFVLQRRFIKHNFRPYNRRYTSPNENFEYGYPHSNALFDIYSSNAQYFAPNVSFMSNAKPHVNQSQATCSDGLSQNLLTQILDVIQSDVALYSQAH